MKNQEKYNQAFEYFKQSYSCKMGGTQAVILPNGKSKHFDDREYYSGRGTKYNSNINHDVIGDVKVTKKEYSKFLQMLKDREEAWAIRKQKEAEKASRISEAKEKGIYSIEKLEHGTFIELSDHESYERTFDSDRLARTLDISIDDAELLKSKGKTYVFAKTMKGDIVRLYHPSLDCNHLSINIDNATEDEIKALNHNEWLNAPYANLVGQTSNKNHFVC